MSALIHADAQAQQKPAATGAGSPGQRMAADPTPVTGQAAGNGGSASRPGGQSTSPSSPARGSTLAGADNGPTPASSSSAATDGRAATAATPSSPTIEQVSYDQAMLTTGEALSQSQPGLGKVDPSMDELDQTLGPQQPRIFSDLRTLQDQIVLGGRPVANVAGRYSTQSDHLDIAQAELSQDLYFQQGRSQLRLGFQELRYTPEQGYGIRQEAIGGTGNYRVSDLLAVAGEYWSNWITADHGAHDTVSTYDVFVTLWPSDYVRIDLDTNGRTFDNVRSLQLGIVARSVGGSVDYTPSNRWRFTVRGRAGFYTDGNHRQSGEVEVVWQALNRPRIDIGVLGTTFHYDRLLDNGYFNPSTYRSGEALARLQYDMGKKLTVELAGSAGVEDADPGGTKPLVKASLQLRYRLSRNWSLDGGIAHFSSRTSTSSGFARTSFTLGLHLRF